MMKKAKPLPTIELKHVKSSAIKAHGYDPKTRTMRVWFNDRNGEPGGKYDLAAVKPETYEAFAGAESFGKHFMQHIRTAHKSTRVFI